MSKAPPFEFEGISLPIMTDEDIPSLKNVRFNGGSEDGVITSARIEINKTTVFLDEIKALVEEHYKIEFPEPKVKTMDLGDVKMKITSYELIKDGLKYRVTSSEGSMTMCGCTVDPVRPRPSARE